MKKILLIAAVALMSVAASAQNLKFAYIDLQELVYLMPEMEQAMDTLDENQRTNEEILMAMVEEYQTKAQQYQQKSATWTPAVRESKEKEIMDIQTRLQQTEQSLAQEIQQLQSSLQAPIFETAQKTVNDIAKAQGFAAVLVKEALLYVDDTQVVNLMPMAREALGIPADRTIESVQAARQAKLQAAAAAAQGN